MQGMQVEQDLKVTILCACLLRFCVEGLGFDSGVVHSVLLAAGDADLHPTFDNFMVQKSSKSI